VLTINVPELEIPKSKFSTVELEKLTLHGVTLVYDTNSPDIVIVADSAKFDKLKW
jgi:hypothetical protein